MLPSAAVRLQLGAVLNCRAQKPVKAPVRGCRSRVLSAAWKWKCLPQPEELFGAGGGGLDPAGSSLVTQGRDVLAGLPLTL